MKTLILCGGSGTRLWPISRTTRPKQFAPVIEHKSLFEMTLERNAKVSDEFLIVVNEKQVEHSIALSKAFRTRVYIEPSARNTAPAVALTCFDMNPDEIVLVVPSDHLITANQAYYECVQAAEQMATQGNLVTFGIKAKFPETGYGYIEADGTNVLSFKEKPDQQTAISYVAKGNYFWNSGMFCFKAGVFLDELKAHAPELYQAMQKVHSSAKKNPQGQQTYDKHLMNQAESISIDYAVMERSKKVKVVPSPIEWSDLGSFDSLYEQLSKDQDGNTIFDQLVSYNSKNNLVIGAKRLIATFDVSDLVIIDTDDAVLIGKKGKTQNVKELVEKLKKLNPSLLD